jgi:selenocysteine lyase/cysteine desulfurase
MDPVEQWRNDTPAARRIVHLNNAGASLMPRVVVDTVVEHLRLEEQIGGYEATDRRQSAIAEVYETMASFLGCRARNIALVENSTVAFSQALAAFDFAPGDRIVTTRNDYISNQIAFLALARRRGIEVVRAADLAEGGADPQDFARQLARPNVRVATVSWMPTNSGLIQDVPAIAAACTAAGVPLIVDACQVVGQMPVDANALGCHFLCGTSRKFLRGPRGIGFLFVSDAALDRGMYPLALDMQGARWSGADRFELVDSAQRFENWEFAHAIVLGLGAAARYALGIGLETIASRCQKLAAYARTRLAALDGATILDRGRRRGAIVTLHLRGHDPRDIVPILRQRGINTTATLREWAILDMEEKGVDAALRVSPHYYNTTEEIDRLAEELREMQKSGAVGRI